MQQKAIVSWLLAFLVMSNQQQKCRFYTVKQQQINVSLSLCYSQLCLESLVALDAFTTL